MGLVISVLYLCLFLAAGILAVRRVLPGEGSALYLPLGCAAAVTLLAGLPALFALVSGFTLVAVVGAGIVAALLIAALLFLPGRGDPAAKAGRPAADRRELVALACCALW